MRVAGRAVFGNAKTTPPAPPPSASAAAVATKAALLRRLELDVSGRLDGMLSGDYLATTAGPGSEPADAREYGPGDDARHIDWSLSARALKPHVRTTDADRELETWLVVDRSASLDFGTAQREKREVALAAVAAFGFLTVRAGNRLGVLVAGGEKLARHPARSGRVAILSSLAALYDTRRADAGPPRDADLAAALTHLERTQPRRGQVVVVSDFLDPSEWSRSLRRLAIRHQVVAVQVTDPREFALPAVGMLEVVDTETGRTLHVQTDSASLRDRYAAAAADRQRHIERGIVEAGAEHLRLSTDRDWLVDIVRFVGRRHRNRPAGATAVRRGTRARSTALRGYSSPQALQAAT